MSVTIRRLNADSSFLLTFAPASSPDPDPLTAPSPGTYTILIDPWLTGSSSYLHPRFQTTHHTLPSAVTSLAALEPHIDLILISQANTDHCHRETLCTLSPNTTIPILATPAAAKTIRSWKFFANPPQILRPYHPRHPKDSIRSIRVPVPGGGEHAELTLANVPSKYDLTALHNAIAITYQAPSGKGDFASAIPIRVPLSLTTPPPSAPASPLTPPPHDSVLTPTPPPSPPFSSFLSSPPPLPLSKPTCPSPSPLVSILYTPHGLPNPSLLQTYMTTHFPSPSSPPSSALYPIPLTALIHSLHTVTNPSLLGGTISTGAPGVLALLATTIPRDKRAAGGEETRLLRPKVLLAAHDEPKRAEGWATRWLRVEGWEGERVRGLVSKSERRDGEGEMDVVEMRCGEVRRLWA